MLHVLLGARADALLLWRGQHLTAEGDDALGEAALHEAVEHAQRVLELHLLELLVVKVLLLSTNNNGKKCPFPPLKKKKKKECVIFRV